MSNQWKLPLNFLDLITSKLYFNLTLLTFILSDTTIFNFLYFTHFYSSHHLLLFLTLLRICRTFSALLYFLITNMTEKYKEEISPDKMLKQAQKTKGYLLKKSSGIITSWNQRYFIILNGALAYYGDEALEKQKG